jgi:drug/metabolite transporter (DMT)-like permease
MTTRAGEIEPPQTHIKAIAYMVASAACWGGATVMTKGALTYMPPLTLLVTQLFISLVFLAVLLVVLRVPFRFNRSIFNAALCGALEPGLAYILGMFGLAMTTATSASIIASAEPILVVALAMFLFRIRTSLRHVMAIIIAIIGVICASSDMEALRGNHVGLEGFLGDGLVLLATIMAALYVLLTNYVAAQVSPLLLTFLQQMVGLCIAILALGVVLIAGLESLPPMPGFWAWVLILGSGIVQYSLAFWCYLKAVQTLPVSNAALFLTLTPVFGIVCAIIFLGESINGVQVVGCLLVLGAIFAAQQRPPPVPTPNA